MSGASGAPSASSSSRRARVDVVPDETELPKVIDLTDVDDLDDLKLGDEVFFDVLDTLVPREVRRRLPDGLQELSDQNGSNGEKVINYMLKKKFGALVDEKRDDSATELERFIRKNQEREQAAQGSKNDNMRSQLDDISNAAFEDGLFSKYKRVITYWKLKFANLKTNRGPAGKHLFRVVNGRIELAWEWNSRSWPRILNEMGPDGFQYVDVLIIDFLEKTEAWVRDSIIDAAEHNRPAPDFKVFSKPENEKTSALDSDDQGVYIILWKLVNDWLFAYCGSTTTSFEHRMTGHIGRSASQYVDKTTNRFVPKKGPREHKATWFENNCEAFVLVPQSKDVAEGIVHGQETLAMILWRFNEETMDDKVAGANLNGVDSLTSKAKLEAASLVAFMLLVQRAIEAGKFAYERNHSRRRTEWLEKKIEQLKLNVALNTLERTLAGIDRSWALQLIHDKNAGKYLKNPWAELKQGGIAAWGGQLILASVPKTKPVPGERSPPKPKAKKKTQSGSSEASSSSKKKKEKEDAQKKKEKKKAKKAKKAAEAAKAMKAATGSKRRAEDYEDDEHEDEEYEFEDEDEDSRPMKRLRRGDD